MSSLTYEVVGGTKIHVYGAQRNKKHIENIHSIVPKLRFSSEIKGWIIPFSEENLSKVKNFAVVIESQVAKPVVKQPVAKQQPVVVESKPVAKPVVKPLVKPVAKPTVVPTPVKTTKKKYHRAASATDSSDDDKKNNESESSSSRSPSPVIEKKKQKSVKPVRKQSSDSDKESDSQSSTSFSSSEDTDSSSSDDEFPAPETPKRDRKELQKTITSLQNKLRKLQRK